MQRLISIVAIAAIVVAFNFISARADITPTTAAVGASITGTIVDKDGKAVGAGVEVKLFLHEKHTGKHGGHKQNAGGKGKRPAPLATTTTDANGKFSFANVDPGEYMVGANDKGVGRGHAKVAVAEVTAAAAPTDVTITLEQGKAGGHGKHAVAN